MPNKKRVAQAAIATAPSEEPHRVLAAVRARLHELKVAELQAPSASAAPDAAVHIPVAPSEGKTGDGKGGEGKPTTNKGLSYFSRQVRACSWIADNNSPYPNKQTKAHIC